MDAGDLQDWEVLHGSDTESIQDDSKSFDCIDGDSGGAIRSDYFSLDSPITFKTIGDVSEDGVSVNSNNPSWIDPGSDTRSPRKEFTEFWPDSASDRSDDHKFGELEVNNESALVQNGKVVKDSGNYEEFVDDVEVKGGEDEVKGDGDKECVEDVIRVAKVSEGEKRVIAWWKIPLELLKYCMFRMNPVWTVPMAAAVMGFMILGRRYYRMKRKSKNVHMKVTVDDQKVSQFMNRVAQLNEAFSVVKRVPIIRPQLPASGVMPWPVMSR